MDSRRVEEKKKIKYVEEIYCGNCGMKLTKHFEKCSHCNCQAYHSTKIIEIKEGVQNENKETNEDIHVDTTQNKI